MIPSRASATSVAWLSDSEISNGDNRLEMKKPNQCLITSEHVFVLLQTSSALAAGVVTTKEDGCCCTWKLAGDVYIPACSQALSGRWQRLYVNVTLTSQRCARSSWGILRGTVKCEQWTRQSFNWEFQAHQAMKGAWRPRQNFEEMKWRWKNEKSTARKVLWFYFRVAAVIRFSFLVGT